MAFEISILSRSANEVILIYSELAFGIVTIPNLLYN
nr:MAG TPA: hypothetical protein [Caudoviricetes sp.]